jgi:hypothetical protein
MDPRTVARIIAAGRVVIGAALLAAPSKAAAGWVGADSRKPRTQLLVSSLGVRDLALGLGTAWALGGAGAARPWLLASAAADLVDLGATLRHRDTLPTTAVAGVGALAGGAGLVGAWLVTELD